MLEGLKRERNLGKLAEALAAMAYDQKVNETVELFHSSGLIHWIETFCYFCTIYESTERFKDKSDDNMKSICNHHIIP